MDKHFDIDPSVFQERKRRRISAMNVAPPPPKVAPTSAPGIHEIATFLPGRLEFEHEIDNEAEDLVKDLEFGICMEWGGDDIVEDENDLDVKGRQKLIEDKKSGLVVRAMSETKGSPMPMKGIINGTNGVSGDTVKVEKSEDVNMENGTSDADAAADEITQPPPIETKDSLAFKLTLMEMYAQRLEKRREGKALIFERGLLEYKKVRVRVYFLFNHTKRAIDASR